MPLAPKLKALIDHKQAQATAPQWDLAIERVRGDFRALWTPDLTGVPPPVLSKQDRAIESQGHRIPVRVYRPAGAETRPALLYLHGGGYVKGGIEESDVFCQRLAAATSHVVVSVGYRLAPEHRFPAAFEDAVDSAIWLAEQASALGARGRSIVLCGESAGGNLAAAACLAARERGQPAIDAQVLIQPVLDFSLSLPSIAISPEQCLVPRADLAWYYRQYLGASGDARDPRISPLYAPDVGRLPPTLVLTAEFDSLRDEGAAYADRLRSAGVHVAYTCWPGMIHGFLQMAGLVDDAQRAIHEIAAFLATAPVRPSSAP